MEEKLRSSGRAVRHASDPGFLASIPWWVYVIVMVVGIGLAILFFILSAGARRRARAVPPGTPGVSRGTGMLVGAIVSLLLLVVAPLVVMLIAQPWSASSSRSSDRRSSYDDEDDYNRGSDRRADSVDNGGNNSSPDIDVSVNPPVGGPSGNVGSGALASQLSAAAAQLRARLPLRQGPTTITAVDTEGTQLVMYVAIAQDFSSTEWSQLDQVLRTNTCSGNFAPVVRMGGSVDYRMEDSGGEQHSVAVSSC